MIELREIEKVSLSNERERVEILAQDCCRKHFYTAKSISSEIVRSTIAQSGISLVFTS